jgi:peptidyl-tRNA hydrolase
MYIIAGLGNPGKKYENTKHNIGFITLDFLAERNDIKINKIKHKALVGEGIISGQKVLLVKPQTFMNLSGNSIREVMEYYKADPEKLIVIYDDVDIAMGRLRIRKKGSAGTHNGMRSIIYDLQEDGFPRVRIGIGKERKMPLAGYVLGGFEKDERELMEDAVRRAALAIECILEKGIDIAMGEYNITRQECLPPR